MKPSEEMSISLPPELEQMVQAEVERGAFASTSEVIRDALRERYRDKMLKDIDAALDRGIADIDAGRAKPVDQAFAEIRTALGLKGHGNV